MDANIVLGAAIAFCVVMILLLLFRQQKLSGELKNQKADEDTLTNQLRRLQTATKVQEEKLHELTTAISGMSDKLQSLSRQSVQNEGLWQDELKKLQDKVQELESADPDARIYTKATKLVSSGASIEEVMAECDLPRAEAELLMNLHTQKQ